LERFTKGGGRGQRVKEPEKIIREIKAVRWGVSGPSKNSEWTKRGTNKASGGFMGGEDKRFGLGNCR